MRNCMTIGVTKELKNHEYRVGLTPDNVSMFTVKGRTVYVEARTGEGARFSDGEYGAAGAQVMLLDINLNKPAYLENHALLHWQYARRRAAHVYHRAVQHNGSVRHGNRRAGLGEGMSGGPQPCA